jgi:hypothetical protein
LGTLLFEPRQPSVSLQKRALHEKVFEVDWLQPMEIEVWQQKRLKDMNVTSSQKLQKNPTNQ